MPPCGRNSQGKVVCDIADKGFYSTKNMIAMDSIFTVAYIERKVICLSLASLSCPRHRRMISRYSSCAPGLVWKSICNQGSLFKQLEEKQGNTLVSPMKTIKGASVTEKKLDKSTDDLYIPLPFLPYEDLSSPSSEGLLIQQIFKEFKSAGLRLDCLCMCMATRHRVILLNFNYCLK